MTSWLSPPEALRWSPVGREGQKISTEGSNLRPGPELLTWLTADLSWCSSALQSLYTPVVGRVWVTTRLLGLTLAFEAFLPELISRSLKERLNPLMGLKPPSEPFQETPSRRIANPKAWPGPDPLLGFLSLRHISASALSRAVSKPPHRPRPGFPPSPRALATLRLLTMFQVRAPMGL
jgi:hypothetical protein